MADRLPEDIPDRIELGLEGLEFGVTLAASADAVDARLRFDDRPHLVRPGQEDGIELPQFGACDADDTIGFRVHLVGFRTKDQLCFVDLFVLFQDLLEP